MKMLAGKFLRCFSRIIATPRDYALCTLAGIRYDTTWSFIGFPHITTFRRRGNIRIGKRFKAASKIRANSIGVFQPVVIKSFPGATVTIGDDVGISGSTLSARTGITLGDRVLVGSGCLITDSDAHPLAPEDRHSNPENVASAPITIGDDVFVGARSILLKGITIGTGSVVGAGSVVTKDVPPCSIVAGNPARLVGTVNASSKAV